MTVTDTRVLELERIFQAPRDRVYRAFTDPSWFGRWFGPPGTQNSEVTIDARVGGKYSLRMQMPDGGSTRLEGEFTVVEPGKALACTFQWSGQQATSVTYTFADVPGGGTLVTLRHSGFPDDGAIDEHRSGWTGSFDRLDQALADA